MLHFFRKQNNQTNDNTLSDITPDNVPQHVAVIMDGNGRWAKSRGLPRVAGHRAGMQTIKRITKAADRIGVKILTLYAFSTENWKRPQDEVDYLLRLPQQYLAEELQELIDNNVRVRMTGWTEGLPGHTLEAVTEAVRRTEGNTGLILNFALNYGSRKEIVDAIHRILDDIEQGKINKADLDERRYADYLLTSGLPDPDLLIRTSGELRLSNFMLWQLAYAEFWFTPLYWPEFSEEHFYEAVREYQRRIRRYGGL